MIATLKKIESHCDDRAPVRAHSRMRRYAADSLGRLWALATTALLSVRWG